jgi:cold shock CspA family protein
MLRFDPDQTTFTLAAVIMAPTKRPPPDTGGVMAGRREQGTVTLWRDARGYGRIKADSGDEVWVIFTPLAIPPKGATHTGLRVEFTRERRERVYAAHVVALDSAGRPSALLTE